MAKIYFKNKGEDLVHYITNPIDMISYVPFSEITEDDHISAKWVKILSIMRTSWEIGDMDIYAVIRLKPEPEFILTNKNIKMPPLDKITGCLKKELIIEGQPMIYRMVDVDELDELLNNK